MTRRPVNTEEASHTGQRMRAAKRKPQQVGKRLPAARQDVQKKNPGATYPEVPCTQHMLEYMIRRGLRTGLVCPSFPC
jgi:hypothetical protein